MRAVCLFAALVACGPRTSAPPAQTPAQVPAVPRLMAPPLGDPAARGATYLAAVSLALQPPWHQFLEDCRLRLPPAHPLNEMTLTATAEIELDEKGHVEAIQIGSSGNKDFDRAARQVVLDASPLPLPPKDLWSDDDHVHLVWTFARDRRQAGPATAQIVEAELPLRGVVARLIAQQDLARAARRIARAKPGTDRQHATWQLMVATLREALDSSDSHARRLAVETIGRAGLTDLTPLARDVLDVTSDVDLQLAALDTLARAPHASSVERLSAQLGKRLQAHDRLVVPITRALVANHVRPFAKSSVFVIDPANPFALQALAHAPEPHHVPTLEAALASKNARVRAAACTGLGGYPGELALIARGMRDRDANVRAACLDAARVVKRDDAKATKRVRELLRDRDSLVRAAAVRALAHLDPDALTSFADDRASEVRIAYAEVVAIAQRRDITGELRKLIDDRDPDVRAAAWTTLVAQAPLFTDRATLAQRAATDSAAQVRRAALPALANDELLLRLATLDDSSDVRTAAMVELASRRGRAGSADLLLQRLADASPGSAERVRTALAWLVAR